MTTTTNNAKSNETSSYSNEKETIESMDQCTSDDIYTVITETEYSQPDSVGNQYKRKERRTEQHRDIITQSTKDAVEFQEEQAETAFQKQDDSNYETQTENKNPINWRVITIVVLVIIVILNIFLLNSSTY